MKKVEICRPSIRLHREEYDIVKRAASLSGQSVQDFMSNAALVQTRKVLEGRQGAGEGQGTLSVLDSPLLLQQFRMVALGVRVADCVFVSVGSRGIDYRSRRPHPKMDRKYDGQLTTVKRAISKHALRGQFL